jgi:ketosteroid isomerase-like protein
LFSAGAAHGQTHSERLGSVPALAQEQNTVDPEVRQQIEAAVMKFDEAFNKHDAAAIAALYTQDTVQVGFWTGEGDTVVSGQERIDALFVRIKARLSDLEAMAEKLEAVEENGVYRFYHGSYKVFNMGSPADL